MKKGYLDKLIKRGMDLPLTDTTLYHPSKVSTDVTKDLEFISSSLNIEVEKWVIVHVEEDKILGKLNTDPTKRMNRMIT